MAFQANRAIAHSDAKWSPGVDRLTALPALRAWPCTRGRREKSWLLSFGVVKAGGKGWEIRVWEVGSENRGTEGGTQTDTS